MSENQQDTGHVFAYHAEDDSHEEQEDYRYVYCLRCGAWLGECKNGETYGTYGRCGNAQGG